MLLVGIVGGGATRVEKSVCQQIPVSITNAGCRNVFRNRPIADFSSHQFVSDLTRSVMCVEDRLPLRWYGGF